VIDPKVKFGALFEATGPPFDMYPLVPDALIVTDIFRLWSPGVGAPFTPLLFTMVGGPTDGTAGWMGFFPFTGEIELPFPCCGCAEPPTATGGSVLDAIGGDEMGFLVALAYERAVG